MDQQRPHGNFLPARGAGNRTRVDRRQALHPQKRHAAHLRRHRWDGDADTAIALGANWTAGLFSANTAGIFAGLYLGKPLGITLWSLAAVKLGLSQWPGDLTWKHRVGAGFLGGIGFTMPIFITLLAFDDPGIVQSAKVAILCSALAAGTTGFLLLNRQTPTQSPQ